MIAGVVRASLVLSGHVLSLHAPIGSRSLASRFEFGLQVEIRFSAEGGSEWSFAVTAGGVGILGVLLMSVKHAAET